jgi:hypothetical protein
MNRDGKSSFKVCLTGILKNSRSMQHAPAVFLLRLAEFSAKSKPEILILGGNS